MTRRDLLTRFLQGLLALPFLAGFRPKEEEFQFPKPPSDEALNAAVKKELQKCHDVLRAQQEAGGKMPYIEGNYLDRIPISPEILADDCTSGAVWSPEQLRGEVPLYSLRDR